VLRWSTGSEVLGSEQGLTNRWLVLALLVLVYALNGADRQILSVLAEPVRQDLDLTDKQLGLLSGAIFAVFYTAVGLPIAWLADRVNRVRVVVAACLFWSACTAFSGMALNFAQLALSRIGVAVGEAGCAPPSYSLLSDYFPPGRRATALGIFSLGFPLGIALGTAACGWITAHYGWRSAFLAMTLPGVVLGLLLLLVVRHPRRGRLDVAPAQGSGDGAPPLLAVCRDFFRRPVLRTTTIAGCFASFSTYGLMVWMPAFLIRDKGMTMLELASAYSFATGAAMMLGMLAGGYLTDRLVAVTRAAPALVPGIAYLVCVPLLLAAIWTDSWRISLLCAVLPFALMVMWLPPSLATLQDACPARSRAVTSAIFVSVTAIVGNSGGPFFIGWVSDLAAVEHPGSSLRIALTAFVPGFGLAGLAQLLVARAILREPPPLPA